MLDRGGERLFAQTDRCGRSFIFVAHLVNSMNAQLVRESVENLEIRLLLDSIFLKYGYDFRGYSPASLKRRVRCALTQSGCGTFAQMQHRILHESSFFSQVLNALTITVTQFYRDPEMYRNLREDVLPYLRTYPEIKIWLAGCATGEEVYSLAVLLEEEGLLNRTFIYATDINQNALKKAKEGIFTESVIREAENNYLAAGGKFSMGRYHTAAYGSAIFKESLKEHLVFSDHNLVSDSSFGEMNLIFCRNVLIYFGNSLQSKAFALLDGSLCQGGFLVLGSKESLSYAEIARRYDTFSPHKIFRKARWV